LIIIGLFTGLFSGAYPAFYLSAFEPVKVLKGKLKSTGGNSNARKILVVIQFTISISLIICTMSVFNQIKHLRNADLGFNKEDILVIPVQRTPIARNFKTFKNELLNNTDIHSVTAMDDILGVAHNTHEFRPEGYPDDKWQFYPALVVQHDFVKTFDMKILAGRDYNEENKTDEMNGILINEAMVKHVGWNSNEEALGKKFPSLSGEEKVIGVFNNFNATSLRETSGPFVLNMKENPGEIMFFLKYMAVKINPDRYKESISFIEEKWKEFAPERPFEYTFLNQELDKLYGDDENLGSLSLVFTALIIFIAALGLLGLASYLAEQRTKEIGIRKILGASAPNITLMLCKEFFILVLVSNAV
ncbi:MAG: hypothetical protein KAR20_16635, partial [Candidatus Heimdallarchaeota archaeon]|nr:hypothetical protein [Candidatus Heimdallarchaeota archaeon]